MPDWQPDVPSAFVHDILPASHIRLLRYDLASASGGLRFKLDTHSKDNAPPYMALSYRWGTSTASDACSINNRNYRIGHELFEALQSLRSMYTTTYLWIDALCINQGHIEERNHQVAIMDEIFRSASTTIVWLGTLPQALHHEAHVRPNYLAEQPYWSRTWIVQEILVSTSVVIHAKVGWQTCQETLQPVCHVLSILP